MLVSIEKFAECQYIIGFLDFKILSNIFRHFLDCFRLLVCTFFRYCYLSHYKLLKLSLILLIIIENCFYLGKGFRSLEFIDFMGKSIGCYIVLQSQLKLSYYPFMQCNFQSNVRDRNRFSESTFNLQNPIFVWVFLCFFFNISFDTFNCLNNILYFRKSAFSSNHITYGEFH